MTWTNEEEAMAAISDADKACDMPLMFRLCGQAVEQFPQSPKLMARYAFMLYWQGRKDESLATIAKALNLGPKCALAWAVNSNILTCEASLDEAEKSAERALSLDNADPKVFEFCVSVYQMSGQKETSLELVNRRIDLTPSDVDAYVQRIIWTFNAGHRKEALQLITEAEERFPESPAVKMWRASSMLGTDTLGGVQLLQECVKECPGSAAMSACLASGLAYLGRLDAAEAAARRALDISPITVTALRAMVMIYSRRGKRTEAQSWQKRASEAMPVLALHSSLTGALEANRRGQWGQVLKAVKPILDSVRLQSTRQMALELKARALLETARLKEAEAAVNELDSMGYDGPTKYEIRGRVMMARWDREGAEAMFRAGIERHPKNGLLRSHLLLLLAARGFDNEVRTLVHDSLDNLPDTPWGMIHLHNALLATGHREKALEVKNMGMARFPDYSGWRPAHALPSMSLSAIFNAFIGKLLGWRGSRKR